MFYEEHLDFNSHKNVLRNMSRDYMEGVYDEQLVSHEQDLKPFWLGHLDRRLEKIICKTILNIYPPTECQFCKKVYNVDHHLNFQHVFGLHLGIDGNVVGQLLDNDGRGLLIESLVDMVNWYCYCSYDFAPAFPKLSRNYLRILESNHFMMIANGELNLSLLRPHHRAQYAAPETHLLFGPLIYVGSLLQQVVEPRLDRFYIYKVFRSMYF